MWLHVPTSHFSAEPEDSTLLSESQCQRLAAHAMWRAKSRQPQFWRRAWKKAPWIQRLSGLTLESSTAQAGVDAWRESWAASLAPICQSPVDKPESTAKAAVSGGSLLELFAKFNPDGCLLKTSLQCSIWEQDQPYSENLPTSGSMRNGSLYRRPQLEPRIFASECSSWPSPRAEDSEACGNHPAAMDSLTGASAMWRTPTACSENSLRGSGQDAETRVAQGHAVNLQDQTKMWSTPNVPNVPNGGRTLSEQDILSRGKTAKGKRQVGLENEARLWHTPSAGHPDKGGAQAPEKRLAGGHTLDLQDQVSTWATPSARDWKSGDASEAVYSANAGPLNEQAERFQSSLQDPTAPNGKTCWCGTHGCDLPFHKRRLNPLFAAWLMGWPIFWTLPEPMPCAWQAMVLWLSRARLLFESFGGGDEA